MGIALPRVAAKEGAGALESRVKAAVTNSSEKNTARRWRMRWTAAGPDSFH